MDAGVIRVKLKRTAERLFGAIQLMALGKQMAKPDVSMRAGVAPNDCLANNGDCFFHLSIARESIRERQPISRDVRLELHDAPCRLNGSLMMAGTSQKIAQ